MAKILEKYSKTSDLNNIKIKVGDETFKFNLYEELAINENIINAEIRNQPSIYGFLGMLLTKVNRIKDDAEKEKEKVFAILFSQYKDKFSENTQKTYTDDAAKAMATKNKKYQEALTKYHQAKQNSSTIYTVVKSFEQRYSLIQTLSANLRDK